MLVGVATTNLCLESVGDAKLIVSVSLGTFALFRWRRQSCPSDEGGSGRLDHGDILVMDGQCQDEFLHRTDPGREQDRINVTFRACFLLSFAEGRGSMLFANVCAGFISSCYGECSFWRFFGFFGFLLVSCAYGES